jgi:hypothetical protein
MHTAMVCARYTLTRAPVLIFAGMQHLPAIRDQVSAFVSALDARALYVLTGMELLTARYSRVYGVSIGRQSVSSLPQLTMASGAMILTEALG